MSSKKPAKKSKLSPNASAKEYQRYISIFLEDILSQTNVLIETLNLLNQQLVGKLDSLCKERKEPRQTFFMDMKQTLDRVADKVERHDIDIARLKSAAISA